MKNKNDQETSKTLFRLYLKKVLSIKYFYIVCILLFVAGAFLNNKYSTRVYQISSTIGPIHDTRRSVLTSSSAFENNSSYNQGINIEDDINSLSSFTLIESTLNKMNLEVGYFDEKKNLVFRQGNELYTGSPFIVVIDKSHIQPIDSKFYITPLSDSTFLLSVNNKKASYYNYIDNYVTARDKYLQKDTVCKYNSTLSNKYFRFSVSKNRSFIPPEDKSKNSYFFKLYHLEEMAKQYQNKLEVKPISFNASLIKIQFTGENIEKSISFLNNYIDAFLDESLAKKNKMALNTIKFIDSQISELSDSLVISESRLKNFRTANQVTDLSFQGQRIYDQLEQIEAERADLEVQKRYYEYVLTYSKTNQDMSGVTPPVSAKITDPIMNTLYTELLALNAEKSNIISSAKGKNIFLGQIESKIRLQNQAIIDNVTNNLNTINLTLNELNYRAEKLNAEISNLPRTEMNMVNIQRKFNLNDANYTLLLQKRTEAAITLASNFPEFEILEPARAITSELIKPKTVLNYLVSLFLAMLIPTLFLVGRELFNDRITSIHEIKSLIDRPLLGIIYSNKNKIESIVPFSPRSALAESFRQLRSNLFYKLKSDKSKAVLITSAQPGDGKSFVSVNLAASIASTGIQTILIDCDLRDPSLHEKLKTDNSVGLSNYITNDKTLEEIITVTSVENLHFIPAGPVLPNSAELIESGRLGVLIESLKVNYGYIIIDTAPIGLVADANRLIKDVNHVLVISRNNYTHKTTLSNVMGYFESSSINNYDVVFNDLNLKDSPYAGYSNYYLKE